MSLSDEQAVMRFLSLFSGIGGLDLGLERAGMQCVGQVEIDEFCRAVLSKHWPDVSRFGDIRSVGADELAPLGPIDLVAAGFPCQPSSSAGARKGTEDERWLWPECARPSNNRALDGSHQCHPSCTPLIHLWPTYEWCAGRMGRWPG